MKISDIAGLKVAFLKKDELLNSIKEKITTKHPLWLVTAYSEFLYCALKDPKTLEMLNKADLTFPDGIGIIWAKRFLDISFIAKNFWIKILEAYWQVFYSLLIVGRGGDNINKPIPGSELIWDIAKTATENNLSIYLLGGFGDTPKLVAQKLSIHYPLLTTNFSNKNPDDKSVIEDINKLSPDILLVAYGPIKQEQWILENRDKLLSVKLFMGVGGSFDYIAGKRISPPKWIRKIGLEWLFRLFTQPHRIRRIYNATFGLIDLLVHYKVLNSMPLRQNVVIATLNRENKILVCQRNSNNYHIDIISTKEITSTQNYWQFPQGGIDEQENVVEAAKRESFEETGLKHLELIAISPKTHTYFWNNALRKFWKNRNHKNKGQTQKIVYFKYLGNDTDVKIDNHEFINYKWISIEDLEKTIHPERQSLVKIVLEDLNNIMN